MRSYVPLVVVLILIATLFTAIAVQSQKQLAQSPRILSAKTVYFENRTGVEAVASKALSEIKKWGRFRVVSERKSADLVFLLSVDPYKGGYILMSGGQTGTVDVHGKIEEDPLPNYNKQAPVRYAYLTVIDPETGENLWSDSRRWGGLLTGFNSVGERLVKELEKQTRK